MAGSPCLVTATDITALGALCRLAAVLATNGSGVIELERFDWRSLLTLADRHRLSGFLFSMLEDHPLRQSLPPSVLSHWKLRLQQQWVKNRMLMLETARLVNSFDAHGLELIHMKGPLMGQRLYGRPEVRSVSDIDLLVRYTSEVPLIERCLTACGYRRSSRLMVNHRCTRWFTYQLEYWKEGIPVELHWSFQRDPTLHFDLEQIWSNSGTQTLGRRVYRVLSAEDAAVAYMVSVPVDLRLGKLSARTLLEIRLLLEQMPAERTWDAWRARRVAEGTCRVSAAVLTCSLELFGKHPRLEAIAQALSPYLRRSDCDLILTGLAAPSSLTVWEWRWQCLKLSDGALPTSLAWWAISLPARLLAHPTETNRFLRSRGKVA